MPEYFLTTARLGFGKWTPEYYKYAVELWGDKNVSRLITAAGEYNDEEIKYRLNKEIEIEKEHGVQYWPVFETTSGTFTGCCGLRPYDIDKKIYELGFHICFTKQGRGIAFEAATAVINYAFQQLNASALFAGHHPKNDASAHILKKLGFKFWKNEYYEPTGLLHPSYLLKR